VTRRIGARLDKLKKRQEKELKRLEEGKEVGKI